MGYLIGNVTGLAISLVIGVGSGIAQQSSAPSSTPSSTPSNTPQLGKYTAPPKGSELTFEHSIVRLLSGEYKNGTWTAGVEIVLKPGWKTYWRVPGDAGVPTKFDWKNSNNVKNIKVFWPAPNRYEDVTGKSIGYKKRVIFPVTVTPAQSGEPTKLDLRLYYAICSDICVPAQANLGLDLLENSGSNISSQHIKEFARKVPSQNAKGISVAEMVTKQVAGKPVLAVTLTGQISSKTDILVEGSEVAFFNEPKLVTKTDSEQVFHLPIDGIDKLDEIAAKKLVLTILSGDIRLQTAVKLN